MSAPRPCRACGMTIEMIAGPNGRAIPAQRVRNVYRRVEPLIGEGLERVDVPRDVDLYVSHFETCPKASEFRRRASA